MSGLSVATTKEVMHDMQVAKWIQNNQDVPSDDLVLEVVRHKKDTAVFDRLGM